MDGRLKAQQRALSPLLALKLLQSTSAESAWDISQVLRIEKVKHRPGRRLTVRYVVEARRQGGRPCVQTLYGKLYRRRTGERIYRALSFLRSVAPPGLRFPEPIGYHPRRRFLLLGALEGLPLDNLLCRPQPHVHLSALGCGLTALHGLSVGNLPIAESGGVVFRSHDALAETEVLKGAGEQMARESLPAGLKDRFCEIHGRVCEGLSRSRWLRTGATRCIIHRDLYPEQVIVFGRQIGLVDLDEASLGEPELDVGNFIAHLMLTDLQQLGTVGPAFFLAQIFLGAYCGRSPISESRLAAYTASSLLRLASLKRLGEPGISVIGRRQLAEALVKEAERALTGTLPGSFTRNLAARVRQVERD